MFFTAPQGLLRFKGSSDISRAVFVNRTADERRNTIGLASATGITGDWTHEVWFRRSGITSSVTSVLINHGNPPQDIWGLNIRLEVQSGGLLTARWTTLGGLERHKFNSWGTIELDTWYHAAVTRNLTTGVTTLYRNGSALGVGEVVGAGDALYTANGYDLLFGRDIAEGAIRVVEGALGEIRSWSVVRTPEQIAANYNKALAGDETGLERYYRFNNNLDDSSPNGSHASLLLGTDPVEYDDGPF